MFNCRGIRIDNLKVVGHWRYNTDGIDIVNTSDVLIKNSFVRSFDDTITIKGIYDYEKPIENITVDNCVMWCGWGKNCEIGIETAAPEYKNIVFRNCDLIQNSVAAMCCSNGCQADMHHILFENINVEFQSNTQREVVQREEEKEYDAEGGTQPPRLVVSSNQKYRIRQKNSKGIDRKASDIIGNIHDITYRNINIFTDDRNMRPQIIIKSDSEETIFKNFAFENICLNGVKVEDFSLFETLFENVENISVKLLFWSLFVLKKY
jgi:polygalacturonase